MIFVGQFIEGPIFPKFVSYRISTEVSGSGSGSADQAGETSGKPAGVSDAPMKNLIWITQPNLTDAGGKTPTGSKPVVIPVNFANFANVTVPSSGWDFAKLLVWGFLAGFAERLIPDTLHRMVVRKVNGLNQSGASPEAMLMLARGMMGEVATTIGKTDTNATRLKEEIEKKAAVDNAEVEEDAIHRKKEIELRAAESSSPGAAKAAASEKATVESKMTEIKEEIGKQAAEDKAKAQVAVNRREA